MHVTLRRDCIVLKCPTVCMTGSLPGSPMNVTVNGFTTQSDGSTTVSQYGVVACSSIAFPPSTYQWEWNDGVTEQFANGSMLIVINIGLRNYTCTASNALGSMSTSVEISVTGRCRSFSSTHLIAINCHNACHQWLIASTWQHPTTPPTQFATNTTYTQPFHDLAFCSVHETAA